MKLYCYTHGQELVYKQTCLSISISILYTAESLNTQSKLGNTNGHLINMQLVC